MTADHSHVMTILGYPKRGADIRGVTGINATDGLPMPILSYANGPGIDFSPCSFAGSKPFNNFFSNMKRPFKDFWIGYFSALSW